jgi:hypothetical protein
LASPGAGYQDSFFLFRTKSGELKEKRGLADQVLLAGRARSLFLYNLVGEKRWRAWAGRFSSLVVDVAWLV